MNLFVIKIILPYKEVLKQTQKSHANTSMISAVFLHSNIQVSPYGLMLHSTTHPSYVSAPETAPAIT